MPKEFQGDIALDVRDSVPDWEPYLAPRAPKGSPNVLLIAWDDVGFGTMECFGGPVRTPTMTRIADMGVSTRTSTPPALCSPTCASLLTGRNATSNGMATIAEFVSDSPDLHPNPVRERVHLRGSSSARLQHVLRRQVAPDPGEETGMAASKKRVAAGPWLRAVLRLPGWGVELLVPGSGARQPPDRCRRRRPRRATTSRRDLSDRAIGFTVTRRSSTRTSRSSCTCRSMRRMPRITCSLSGRTSTRGVFDDGYEAIRAGILARQKELGCCPPTPTVRRSTRTASRAATGPTGSRGRCSTPCALGFTGR